MFALFHHLSRITTKFRLLSSVSSTSKMDSTPPSASGSQKFDYLLILDFEATCDQGFRQPVPQEIIEFPCLKMNTATWTIESEFHRYVRPVAHPQLSTFCTGLTGIVQDMVDNGATLDVTLKQFDEWLKSEGLLSTDGTSTKEWTLVTCGDWDLKIMLKNQCDHFGYRRPDYFHRWINVKRPFSYLTGAFPKGMMQMLEMLNLAHQGRHHSGIDDARNIAEVVRVLGIRGTSFELTSFNKT